MMKKLLLAFICAASMLCGSNVAAIEYDICDLGTFQSDHSEAFCINDLGQICGFYRFQGKQYSYLYDPHSGLRLLDIPEGAIPTKVNNAGQIIGQFQGRDGKDHAFFWDPQAGFVDIGTLGGTRSKAIDLNDAGQVVGYSDTKLDKQDHAFLWEYGSIRDLGVLHGEMDFPGDSSSATAINNRGDIVGTANLPIIHKGRVVGYEKRAVVWDCDGEIREISPTFKGHVIEVYDVNDAGWVLLDRQPRAEARQSVIVNVNGTVFPACYTPKKPGRYINDHCFVYGGGWIWEMAFNHQSCSRHLPPTQVWQATPTLRDKKSIWVSLEVRGMNNNADLIGIAKTIYNETHAVVLERKK